MQSLRLRCDHSLTHVLGTRRMDSLSGYHIVYRAAEEARKKSFTSQYFLVCQRRQTFAGAAWQRHCTVTTSHLPRMAVCEVFSHAAWEVIFRSDPIDGADANAD